MQAYQAPSRPSAFLRRGIVFTLSWVTALTATTVWGDLLAQNGLSGYDIAQIALFFVNYLWVSVFFWSSLIGWTRLLFRGRVPGLVYPAAPVFGQVSPELQDRKPVAILMPICNEEAQTVLARVAAMYLALERLNHRDAFRFYILSDSLEAETWIAEEVLWNEMVRRLGAQNRIFYRHRTKNIARKAGNIADFCTRWGSQHDYMVVFDADSLLTGETLIQLSRMAYLNPKAGIIQGMPALIGAGGLFARTQQFAVRLYGPVIGAGINFWHLGDGNYWGHNAIINVAAFTQCCGLPELPGKPPFGGHILSHDFVEAALIRRGGWEVWLVPEIEGCYEQMPASIIENGKRERRWVQGNLQHSKILAAGGLHPLSRTHLFMGITAFLMPLSSLFFLLIGLASAIQAYLVPPHYFPDYKTLFPHWPVFDGNLALSLLAVTFVMLTLPKLLAILVPMLPGRGAAGYGGRLRLLVSAVLEHMFTILIAPVMMLILSGFVVDVLRRRDSGWGKQNRKDADTTWEQAWYLHRTHMLFGGALALVSYTFAPTLFVWLAPVFVGQLLAVPLSVWSSRKRYGTSFRKAGLLLVPEETSPPAEWTEAEAIEVELNRMMPVAAGPLGIIDTVLHSPQLNALHLSLLTENAAGFADKDELAKARRKLAALQRGEAIPALSASERYALLFDTETLRQYPMGVAPVLP